MKPQDMEEHVKAWQERWRQEGIRGAGAKRAGAGAAQVLAQAKKYRVAGDLSQAEAVLQEALTSYPDDPLLQGQLAWVKLAEGDLVSAEHLARAALGQRPQDPSALAALAEVFRRQRRYAEAEDFLRVAAEQATTTFAVTRLAALYLETGNREAAEEVLQQALVRHPEDAQLRAMLARVYAAQGDNRRALALYEEAMELAPEDEFIYQEYLKLLARDAGGHDALLELSKLLRLPSRAANPHLWFLHGRLLYSAGRYEEALASFTRVLQLRPDYRLALKFVGYCANRLGHYDEAIAHLERALAAEPGDHHVRKTLQACYRRAGRLEDGLRFFTGLAKRYPDCRYLWDNVHHLRKLCAGKGGEKHRQSERLPRGLD